jgi:nucleoside-diphosphate-sugar epimerase
MKALVTGGSGFIGSTLIEALTSRGIEVDVLMRKTSSDRNLQGLKYQRLEGDIGDFSSLRRAVDGANGIDLVFHLAGVIAAKNRDAYFQANAEGTGNLARAISEANRQGAKVRRVVYVSTLAAGGCAASRDGRLETEDDSPVSAYGESKRAGEKALLAHADSFRPVMIRPPLVYGPKDQATFLLVKTVAKRIVPKFPSKSADGEKYYSVVHSRDLVEAIVALGLAPDTAVEHGEIFYVSSGEQISSSRLMGSMAESLGVRTFTISVPFFVLRILAKVGDFVGRLLGKATVVNSDKLNEVRPDYWTCSNRKLMEKTGWRPKILFDEGIRDAVAWYRQNGWI